MFAIFDDKRKNEYNSMFGVYDSLKIVLIPFLDVIISFRSIVPFDQSYLVNCSVRPNEFWPTE
jgi:hypothetical protein